MTNENTNYILGLLDQMTAHLIESHMEELESCHAGDAELAGIAPEACSYCKTIQESIDALELVGRDVRHLKGV